MLATNQIKITDDVYIFEEKFIPYIKGESDTLPKDMRALSQRIFRMIFHASAIASLLFVVSTQSKINPLILVACFVITTAPLPYYFYTQLQKERALKRDGILIYGELIEASKGTLGAKWITSKYRFTPPHTEDNSNCDAKTLMSTYQNQNISKFRGNTPEPGQKIVLLYLNQTLHRPL